MYWFINAILFKPGKHNDEKSIWYYVFVIDNLSYKDYDDGINCTDNNEGLCEASDESGDVWDLWNVSLRDFIILDRYGNEFARVSLTYNNPDPTELGECTGNYQKIKDLILAARNR